jgi:hypothetical protein
MQLVSARPVRSASRKYRVGSKSPRLLGAVCLVALALGGCGAQKPAAVLPKSYRSAEGRFTVLMAKAKPQLTTQHIPSPVGDIPSYFITSDVSKNEAFAVGYFDFPADAGALNVDGGLEGAVNNTAKQNDLKITYKKKGTAYGAPSMDFFLEGSPEKVWGRVFIVDRRFYLIEYVSQNGKGEATYNQFLDSFALTG